MCKPWLKSEQHNRVSSDAVAAEFKKLSFALEIFMCVAHEKFVFGLLGRGKNVLCASDSFFAQRARTAITNSVFSARFFLIYVSTVGGDDEETTSQRSSRDDEGKKVKREEANTTRRGVWRMRGR